MLRRYASPGKAPSARGTSRQPSCLSFEHTLSFRFMATKRVEADVEAPRPTVREAMRSVLSAAKLVAGAEGLDRQVEWVRLMETPEVQPRAGDLMFTSGFPIKDDLDAQIRLVGRIAEGGGAGLVVRPLPYLRKLPPEMVSEADRLQVPLFTIPSDVQFVDLMSPLLERIINAEHWRLKRSMEIHRRFTELVLDGKGVNEICRTLADLLESAVSVEDASFHLLAHAGGSADPHRKETILRQGTPHRVLFDPQIQRILRRRRRAAPRAPRRLPDARCAHRASGGHRRLPRLRAGAADLGGRDPGTEARVPAPRDGGRPDELPTRAGPGAVGPGRRPAATGNRDGRLSGAQPRPGPAGPAGGHGMEARLHRLGRVQRAHGSPRRRRRRAARGDLGDGIARAIQEVEPGRRRARARADRTARRGERRTAGRLQSATPWPPHRA